MEFITGDQPVINLHGGDRSKAPTQLCMYYPIGPSMALIWGDVNERIPYTSETLTTEQVADLDKKMVAVSHSQVFARTETSLAHFAVA